MADTLTPDERLRAVHGNGDCHICGKPRISQGKSICSYPHGRVPVEPIDPARPNGFWGWEIPVRRVRVQSPHESTTPSDREILLEHLQRIYEIAKPPPHGFTRAWVANRKVVFDIALEGLRKIGVRP